MVGGTAFRGWAQTEPQRSQKVRYINAGYTIRGTPNTGVAGTAPIITAPALLYPIRTCRIHNHYSGGHVLVGRYRYLLRLIQYHGVHTTDHIITRLLGDVMIRAPD